MSKFKSILLTGISYVLVVALAIGGTLAYLQDEDSAVNVMTLGNVYIKQHEYQRVVDENGNYVTDTIDNRTSYVLEPFRQGKPLLPIVGDPNEPGNSPAYAGYDDTTVRMTQVGSYGGMQVFAGKNAQDKFVTVENVGKSDAYVRTIVAIEIGSTDGKLIMTSSRAQAPDATGTQPWIVYDAGIISIDGNNYRVVEYIYRGASDVNRHVNGVLPAGDTTYPSLCQVYLKHNATNEDMVAIDGNGNGTLDIIVLSQAVQVAGFENADEALVNTSANITVSAAKVALDTAFGKAIEKAADWFGGIWAEFKESLKPKIDVWDGTIDTTWYNDADTEFTLITAEQLAGLGKLVDDGNTFEGKTIKLGIDMDLCALDANGEPISFEPIGSFSDDKAFEGTFDGQNHTISNLYQSGWALANGYWDGPEYGMGLFSLVKNATVKNLNFEGASLPTEANIIGVVAGGAADCVFENINITGAYLGNHSCYSGGAIGWAEGDVKLINCDIDATSVVSSQWGDFNNANGGLIGGIDGTSTIYLKDCDVACVIDAYNDVTSAYKWYSYRNCGMLIGDTAQKDDPDGNNVGDAIAPNLTCENVTVTYGTWANYHYCEFGSAGYPFCRVEAGESTGAYGNARVGEYTDANGNKVVDDNHAHNTGEKHNELIVFDQLYGGASGDRYCTYGTATHPGVTVIYNNK